MEGACSEAEFEDESDKFMLRYIPTSPSRVLPTTTDYNGVGSSREHKGGQVYFQSSKNQVVGLAGEGRSDEIAPMFSSVASAASAGHSPGRMDGDLKGSPSTPSREHPAAATTMENQGMISPFLPSQERLCFGMAM